MAFQFTKQNGQINERKLDPNNLTIESEFK